MKLKKTLQNGYLGMEQASRGGGIQEYFEAERGSRSGNVSADKAY
jgi:hypothetical protein